MTFKPVGSGYINTDTNTTYSLDTGTGNTVTLTGSNGTSYTRTINNVAKASSADLVYWNNVRDNSYYRVNELGVLDGLLDPNVSGNRLAFIEPAQVAIEYSQDAGSTWTNSGYTDDIKRTLFGDIYGQCPVYVGVPSGGSFPSGAVAKQLMTRITVTMPDTAGSGWGTYGRYCYVNRLLI